MCALTITFADHKNNAFVELGGAAGKTGKEQLEQWKSIPPLRRSPEVTRLCFLRMAPWAVIAFLRVAISRAEDPIRGGPRRESGVVFSCC
jgi:hypothetical protein